MCAAPAVPSRFREPERHDGRYVDAGGTCSRAAIGITGVTDKAYRPERVEQMLTRKRLDAAIIQQAAAEACRNVEPIEDINGSAEYRKQLTEVYVARTIEAALKS